MKPYFVPFLIAGSLFAQGAVQWEHNLDAARARALKENKLIFMDVSTGWCGWCIKLKKDTFPSQEGQAALARFVPLAIETQLKDGSPTADKGIERAYNVEGFPALFVLDANGKVVSQQPGYLPPKDFAAWLNQVLASRKN